MLFSTILCSFKVFEQSRGYLVCETVSVLKYKTRKWESNWRRGFCNFKTSLICTSTDSRLSNFRPGSLYLQVVREKYSKKQTDNLDELNDDKEEDDWKNEVSDKDSQIVKVNVNSLRTDLIVKAGTGTARNKVEALFYQSKIRVNGEKIFKKSSQLKVGDEVDIIRGPSPMNADFLLISRVEVVSANEKEDGTTSVRLRRFKSLTIENYADPWKGTE